MMAGACSAQPSTCLAAYAAAFSGSDTAVYACRHTRCLSCLLTSLLRLFIDRLFLEDALGSSVLVDAADA